MGGPGENIGLIILRSGQINTGASYRSISNFILVFLNHICQFTFFSMSLNKVWEAASKTPFIPLVGKDAQFSVGFNLLLLGKLSSYRISDNSPILTIPLALVTGTLFGLSKYTLQLWSIYDNEHFFNIL